MGKRHSDTDGSMPAHSQITNVVEKDDCSHAIGSIRHPTPMRQPPHPTREARTKWHGASNHDRGAAWPLCPSTTLRQGRVHLENAPRRFARSVRVNHFDFPGRARIGGHGHFLGSLRASCAVYKMDYNQRLSTMTRSISAQDAKPTVDLTVNGRLVSVPSESASQSRCCRRELHRAHLCRVSRAVHCAPWGFAWNAARR